MIGPDQRVDVMTALRAMTIWAPYQHLEEASKGSIEVGKLADLVVFSKDPTRVPPAALGDLKGMETIKEGNTAYRLANQPGNAATAAQNGGRAGESFHGFSFSVRCAATWPSTTVLAGPDTIAYFQSQAGLHGQACVSPARERVVSAMVGDAPMH